MIHISSSFKHNQINLVFIVVIFLNQSRITALVAFGLNIYWHITGPYVLIMVELQSGSWSGMFSLPGLLTSSCTWYFYSWLGLCGPLGFHGDLWNYGCSNRMTKHAIQSFQLWFYDLDGRSYSLICDHFVNFVPLIVLIIFVVAFLRQILFHFKNCRQWTH